MEKLETTILDTKNALKPYIEQYHCKHYWL